MLMKNSLRCFGIANLLQLLAERGLLSKLALITPKRNLHRDRSEIGLSWFWIWKSIPAGDMI